VHDYAIPTPLVMTVHAKVGKQLQTLRTETTELHINCLGMHTHTQLYGYLGL